MSRRGIAAAVAVLLVAALAALTRVQERRSAAEGRALLHWMDSRQGCIPHVGIVVATTYLMGQPITTTARLYCATDNSTRIEYLAPPSLRGVVAVQEGSRVRRDGASHDAVLCGDGAYADTPVRRRRHMALLLRNYEPRLVGHARVAGRPAERLVLTHRHTGLVARRWWVDASAGLILRSESYRSEGPIGERTRYREVRFLDPPRRVSPGLPPVSAESAAIPLAEEAAFLQRLKLPAIRPRYVPIGYECDGLFPAPRGAPDLPPAAHLQYSDGLRALSVFASARDRDSAAPQLIPLPLGAMLRIRHRGARFVFIGEVSEADLWRMARSLP